MDSKNDLNEFEEAIDVVTFNRASWKMSQEEMQSNVSKQTLEGRSVADNKKQATSNSTHLIKDKKLGGTPTT